MTKLIHLRIQPEIKKQIELIVNSGYYGSTTEFIKEQIRKGIFSHQTQMRIMTSKEFAIPNYKLKGILSDLRGVAKDKGPLTRKMKIEAYEASQKEDVLKKYGWKVSESTKKYQKKRDR